MARMWPAAETSETVVGGSCKDDIMPTEEEIADRAQDASWRRRAER